MAASAMLKGGVIAYPTEAVYGLGCNPYDAEAVMRLLQIKHRDISQGLILLGRSLDDFSDFIVEPDRALRSAVTTRQTEPTTWLVPASEHCPIWIRGQHDTVAIRVTDHKQCLSLCNLMDSAIVSTSANRVGHAPLRSALKVRQEFSDELDYLLVGSTGGRKQPSRIIDVVSGKIVR
jgi:L-threonylcarbamoyladenylate synthase